MENLANNYSHIKGWGIDADPKNDPTYPMRKRSNNHHEGINDWDRPTQQPETVEILQSVERPNLTSVFGTSVPPSGLSGMIRRMAFKHSENQYSHWLPLMLADRINVVEGIIEDLKGGKFPNILAEKGMNSDLKHDKKGLAKKAAIVTFLLAAVVVWSYGKKDRDRS